MTKEIKISISILTFGFFAIIVYWMQNRSIPYRLETERILLPSNIHYNYNRLPIIQKYLHDLKKFKMFLPLDDEELDSKAKQVQKILLINREFLADNRDSKGQLLHNDMMTIRPAILSSLNTQSQKYCERVSCYEAIKYNFVSNSTTRAIVDSESKKVLELRRFSGMQPEISQRLRKIAEAIALNAPEVKKELGSSPHIKDMSMANVRGSINASPCENKDHLCVAPTFSYYDKEEALWAIVDLTDLKLTVAKWAGLGKSSTPSCISERFLQNREIMEKFCQKNTIHREDGWILSYRLTGSDGLEVINASFNGEAVLKSAKIVDWHVAYKGKDSKINNEDESYVSGRQLEYIQADNNDFFFGYNDAMGCPMFSTSVVLPFNAPRVKPLLENGQKIGFYLLQDYRNPKWPMACNYRYENRFEFYADGSFRVVGVNIGRGCGENALYRPVMRIDMDLGDKEEFFKYNGSSWDKWLSEQSDSQARSKYYEKEKYLYRIQNKSASQVYFIEPNRGQFNDGSRGDNATLFVTLYNELEGEQDLLTLGSCCKLDEDGVERYIKSPENIEKKDIVLWYVPRIQNDARLGHEYCWADTILENGRLVVKEFPCSVGPKFVAIKNGSK